MINTPRVEFDRLTKRFGDKTAVHRLTLSANPGELLCLLGPNGAGKTTTLQMVVGHKVPTSGDVRINNVGITSSDIRGMWRLVGYLAEQPTLYDYLSGREFLRFVAELYRLPSRRFAWADTQLERYDLATDADSLARGYSTGMRKKIAFLSALLHEPEILLLDEPTGGLDPASARLVKDEMRQAKEDGKVVLFTTHVMELAERLADRIAVICRGQLIFDGTIDEMRDRHGRSRDEALEDMFLRITGRDPAGSQAGSAVPHSAVVRQRRS